MDKLLALIERKPAYENMTKRLEEQGIIMKTPREFMKDFYNIDIEDGKQEVKNMKIRQVNIEDISLKDIEPGKYYVVSLGGETVLDIYYELINEVIERLKEEDCALVERMDKKR